MSRIVEKDMAWVFVIWSDPKYIIGAAAGAHSLRLASTKHKIVLMYSDLKISKEFKEIFDEVIETNLIKHKFNPFKTPRQRQLYGDNFITSISTKWQCLSLEQYSKVLFCDSDVIFQRNCDELFELNTPCACFSTPFAKPYAKKGGMYNAYGYMEQGDVIDSKKIKDGLNNHGYVGAGAMYLFTPSKKDLKDFCNWIEPLQPYGYTTCYSGPDEQSISEFYSIVKSKDWIYMHQKYQAIPWKPEWVPDIKDVLKDAPGLHFYHAKPWEQGEAQGYDDINVWWKIYHSFEDKHKKLAEMLKGYMSAYKER